VAMNFNDYGSAFVLLFVIMITNNWQNFVYMFIISNPKEEGLVKFFFITFYCISVLMVLNISVAFVIEVYTSIFEGVKQEREEKAKEKEKEK